MADPHKHKVALLLPMEGAADGSVVFNDRTGKTVTVNGNTHLSTDVTTPWGMTSAYFDGTGDYLSLTDAAAFQFGSGDFTLEAWVRFAALPAASNGMVFVSRQHSSSNRSWQLGIWNAAGQYQLNLNTSSTGTTTTASTAANVSLSTGVWYHVAGVRHGNTLLAFLDGVLVGSATETGSLYVGSVALNVGCVADPAYYLNGYLKDLRITNGIARYTGNFHVDNKPLDWNIQEKSRIFI